MNHRCTFGWLAITAAAALLPLTATAQPAQTSKWVNLRAGPARDYPLVAQLPPATPLSVQGCVSDFSWCDVITPNAVRGWVYAGNLLYPYQSSAVPLLNYGAVIGLPIITFSIGSYWGRYYRDRPWYGQRSDWAHRPPPYRARPPGPPPRFERPSPRPPGSRPPGPPIAYPQPPTRQPPGVRPPGGRPGLPGAGSPGQRAPGVRPPDRNRSPGAAPGETRRQPGGQGGLQRRGGGDRPEQR